MEHLWAPWRLQYILDEEGKTEKESRCIFCDIPKETPSKENLLLYKTTHCSVIINKFPYNNGHILVSPIKHTDSIEYLGDDESSNLFETLKSSTAIIRKVYNPDGVNIGMNLGVSAGAGIASHIHFHIVPRWESDNNFMPVVANTRVLPELLESTFEKLHKHFEVL